MAASPFVAVPCDLGSATLRQCVDGVVRADAAGWPMVMLAASDPTDPIDGLALAAACASLTRTIGLCVRIDPATVEPFTLARGLATLDHLSRGRAAWRLAGGEPARNAELVAVVGKLLQSWGADALIEDREAGILSDAARVAPIDHHGAFFAVRGPLNMPRPPQSVPPLVRGAVDPVLPGVDFTLEAADILTCSVAELAWLPDCGGGGDVMPLRARLEARS